jgi:signal transduction histidine kinase
MAIKFLNEVVYKELENLEIKSTRVIKILDVMPKVVGSMIEFEEKIKENFEFLMKNIGHLKEIVKLQQSYVGSLGTEDYGDINEIIREALEIFGSSIEKREIELITELGDPKIILCDKNQIFQVISNFVKNSYEAIEEAGRDSGKIAIRSLVEDGMVAIYIADNGLGIKKDNMENIFGFGFSTKKNSGKGSGFGLHSAMTIISKYSGKISVESDYGKGTQFKITLPLYRNKEREARDEK